MRILNESFIILLKINFNVPMHSKVQKKNQKSCVCISNKMDIYGNLEFVIIAINRIRKFIYNRNLLKTKNLSNIQK